MRLKTIMIISIYSFASCSFYSENAINERGNREEKTLDTSSGITRVTEYYGNTDKKYMQYCFRGEFGYCDVVEYYFNGNIRRIKPYINSKSLNGELLEFDSLGNITSKRFFREGKEDGFAYTYNQKALLSSIEYFKNDKLLYSRKYDYSLPEKGFIKEEILAVWVEPESDTVSLNQTTNTYFLLPDLDLITYNKDSFYLKFGAIHSLKFESRDIPEPFITVKLNKKIGTSAGHFDLEGKWLIYGHLYYGNESNSRKISDFLKEIWVESGVPPY